MAAVLQEEREIVVGIGWCISMREAPHLLVSKPSLCHRPLLNVPRTLDNRERLHRANALKASIISTPPALSPNGSAGGSHGAWTPPSQSREREL